MLDRLENREAAPHNIPYNTLHQENECRNQALSLLRNVSSPRTGLFGGIFRQFDAVLLFPAPIVQGFHIEKFPRIEPNAGRQKESAESIHSARGINRIGR